MKETQLKAAEDSAKAWQSMADKVAGVLYSQVSGVINGTTTVKQAFSNMAKSMIEDAAKYAVKWAVEHAFAATQVMAQNTAVTTSALAGQAAQDAAKTTSGAAGVASQAANAVQSIAIDGAKTFGGVFGFLAPLLGPFAAGPAAGAQATVLAAGAAFDTGAWSLPRDMIAAVHQGEMVIPSRGGVADEFRNFMSGGGFDRLGRGDAVPAGGAAGAKSVSINPAVHFNVNAVDGASVHQFFQNNHKAHPERGRPGRAARRRLGPAHASPDDERPLLFPDLVGQGWWLHKKPKFDTRVAAHASGREARAGKYADADVGVRAHLRRPRHDHDRRLRRARRAVDADARRVLPPVSGQGEPVHLCRPDRQHGVRRDRSRSPTASPPSSPSGALDGRLSSSRSAR